MSKFYNADWRQLEPANRLDREAVAAMRALILRGRDLGGTLPEVSHVLQRALADVWNEVHIEPGLFPPP